MTIQDYGIEQLGSYLRGLSPIDLGSCGFGIGGSAFTGSIINLTSEIIRVPNTWTMLGSDPRAQAVLTSNQANGSYITELGLVHGATDNGSDLFSGDLSAIGSKNSTFSVVIDQTIRIRRV